MMRPATHQTSPVTRWPLLLRVRALPTPIALRIRARMLGMQKTLKRIATKPRATPTYPVGFTLRNWPSRAAALTGGVGSVGSTGAYGSTTRGAVAGAVDVAAGGF